MRRLRQSKARRLGILILVPLVALWGISGWVNLAAPTIAWGQSRFDLAIRNGGVLINYDRGPSAYIASHPVPLSPFPRYRWTYYYHAIDHATTPVFSMRRTRFFPLWWAAVLPLLFLAWPWHRGERSRKPGRCRRCGYPVTDLPAGPCPECGEPVASSRSRL